MDGILLLVMTVPFILIIVGGAYLQEKFSKKA